MVIDAVILRVFERVIKPEIVYVSWVSDGKFGRGFGQCNRYVCITDAATSKALQFIGTG